MKKAFLGFAFGVVLITLVGLGLILGQRADEVGPHVNPTPSATKAVAPTAVKPAIAPEPALEPPKPQPVRAPKRVEIPQETELSLSQTLSTAGGYGPGDVLEVRYEIDRVSGKERVTALGLDVALPRGFTFAGMGEGGWPDLFPKEGHGSPHQFAWIKPPQFPVSFTYRIQAPEALRPAPQALASVAIFRTSGGELRSNPASTLLDAAGVKDALDEKLARPTRGLGGDGAGSEKPVAPEELVPDRIVLDRTVGERYTPGELLTVHVRLTRSERVGRVLNFAVTEQIPAGWRMDTVAGIENGPEVVPALDKQGVLTFIWGVSPTFPVEFTYSLRVPAGERGEREISGQAIYGQGEGEVRGIRMVSVLGSSS